jgi:hypothetical protein
VEAVRDLERSESALAKPCRAEVQNTREGWVAADAAICEWRVSMTWLKRAHVVTSGERGPPVVQVIERDTAPSQDSKSARQSPQPRSCGEQGGDELYSQRLCAPGCAASLVRARKKSKPKGRPRGHASTRAAKASDAEARRGRTVRLDKA